MRRRDFVAGGVGASFAFPAFGQGLPEWRNEFVEQHIRGAWLATFSDPKVRPVQFEFYSYSISTEERGAFNVRGGATWLDRTPDPLKSAVVKPSGNGARFVYSTGVGKVRYEFDWRAGDRQEGTRTVLEGGSVSKASLRRLSTAEIDEQRRKVLGEKPTLINTSYFG